MKMKEAIDIIEEYKKPRGFMVHFYRRKDCILTGDYFPDRWAGEKLIETEEEAWELAEEFAKATGTNTYKVYVVNSSFIPVDGYEHKMMNTVEYSSDKHVIQEANRPD